MKVAFWENTRGESMHMDNMAAISAMLSINHRKKTILLDNGQNNHSLEKVFRGINRFYFVREDMNYIIHCNGMDQLLKDIHKVEPMESLLYESAVEIIQNYLYYVPPSKVMNHLAYDYELYLEFPNIIRQYDTISDYTFVRVRNGNHLSTKQVLDEADLVMVELSQENHIIEEFFENYSSICHKAIYVFDQYNVKSQSIFHIMEKYHLKKENIIVISEHLPMIEAYLAGNIVNYLKVNMYCNKESEHYRCIQELKRAAYIILRYERSGLLETIT